MAKRTIGFEEFQSPISGVNDWNLSKRIECGCIIIRFSLLLAELMIGTPIETKPVGAMSAGFSLLLAELMIGTL